METVSPLVITTILLGSLVTASLLGGDLGSLSAQEIQGKKDQTPDTDAPQWFALKPTGARASVEMPIKPRYVERKFQPIQDKPPVKVRLYLATVNEGKTTCLFAYHDLHETPRDAQTIKNTLDGAVKGSVVNVLGQLLAKPKQIRFAGHPGRQYDYRFVQNEKDFFVVRSRVFLVDRRQYQLSCIMIEDIFDPKLADRFLDSFRVVDPDSDLPPRPKVSN